MVVENNLVDRYLLGQMDEAEAMAFEDFYAGSAETMAELEASARLIDGMQRAARRGTDGATDLLPKLVQPRKRGGLRRVLSSPAYGVAASFVALAAILLAVAGNLRTPAATGPTINAINIPVVTLSPTRGSETGISIAAADAPQVVFALDLGMAAAASYSAALHTLNGDMLWRAVGLHPDELQSLTMSIGRDMLPSGDYRIIVRADDASGDTLTFPFRIDR